MKQDSLEKLRKITKVQNDTIKIQNQIDKRERGSRRRGFVAGIAALVGTAGINKP